MKEIGAPRGRLITGSKCEAMKVWKMLLTFLVAMMMGMVTWRRIGLTFLGAVLIGVLIASVSTFPQCDYCPQQYPNDVVACQNCCEDCCRKNYPLSANDCAAECDSSCNYTVP